MPAKPGVGRLFESFSVVRMRNLNQSLGAFLGEGGREGGREEGRERLVR
jgi:hypothetical protein